MNTSNVNSTILPFVHAESDDLNDSFKQIEREFRLEQELAAEREEHQRTRTALQEHATAAQHIKNERQVELVLREHPALTPKAAETVTRLLLKGDGGELELDKNGRLREKYGTRSLNELTQDYLRTNSHFLDEHQSATPSLDRATMTVKEKAAYIDEHGQDKYLKLPFTKPEGKRLLSIILLCIGLSLFNSRPATAQGMSIYAPGGINYGGGIVVRETQGTGAPVGSCSGFVRYWQTDATDSPFWQCKGTTWANIGTGGGGGSSFAVTTTASGPQIMSGLLNAPSFQIGGTGLTDTNLYRCGTKCLGIGSAINTPDGTLKVFQVLGSNVNGTLNAALFAGANIGAQVNAATASCTDATPCHVIVPPGVYSYSTPILLPRRTNVQELTIDRNAVLTYTGTADAIGTQPMVVNNNKGQTMIDGGGLIIGTSAANSGIHIRAGQGFAVKDMSLQGFTAGDGIWVDGANVVALTGNTSQGNLNGLHVTGNTCNTSNLCTWDRNSSGVYVNAGISGATGYAPNAIHAFGNKFIGNAHWGIIEGDVVGGSVSAQFNNQYLDNDLETNGTASSAYGSVLSGLTIGSRYEGNYFEASPRGLVFGCVNGDAGVAIPTGYTAQFCGNAVKPVVTSNFFNDGAITNEVFFAHAFNPTVADNASHGSAACLIDEGSVGNGASIHGNYSDNGSTVEVCSSGSPGGSLASYQVTPNTTIQGMEFHGAVQVDTGLTTGAQANFVTARTCDNVAQTYITIGSTKLFSSCINLTGGSCTGSALGISPSGLSVCKGATWVNP